jgi:DNA polymerase III subunit delta'
MPFRAERAIGLIRQSQQLGRLGHAYLITGPREARLESVAEGIIHTVAGAPGRGSLENWQAHGATLLRPNSKSRKITIGEHSDDIGSMRWFLKAMVMSVALGSHRYGVIVDSERMTPQTQNAFLKTLEEPVPQTLLLLLTHKPEELLTTIRSRVIELAIQPEPGARVLSPQETALLDLLTQHSKLQKPGLPGALALMTGFQALLGELRDEVESAIEEDFDREKALYGKTTDGSYLKTKEDQVKAQIEATYLQRRDALVETLIAWLGDAVRIKSEAADLDLPSHVRVTRGLADRMELPDLMRRISALRKLEGNLHTNVNETLALEVAFLDAFA